MKKLVGESLMIVAALAAASASAALQLVPAPRKAVEGEGSFICTGDVVAQAKFESDAAVPKEGYRLSVAKDGINLNT